MSSLLVQLPVVQKLQKPTDTEGEFEEVTRVVMELVSPSFIVRVSPLTEDRTVIWLSHGVPHVEAALSYDNIIKTLTQAREVQQENGAPESTDSD